MYEKGAGDTEVLDQMPVTHLYITCMCRPVQNDKGIPARCIDIP